MLILEEIDSPTREATIIEWYEGVFPSVATYIQKKGGDLDTAKEVFQEAIVIYYEKLTQENFQPELDHKAYLIGITKNLWWKQLEKSAKNESLDHVDPIEEKIPVPMQQRLMAHLKLAGERCLEVLQSFYYEKLTIRQLADRFSYSSERSATVQKYKCLEKVRDEVKRKSLSYEDFLE